MSNPIAGPVADECDRLRAENGAQRTGLNNIIIITRVRAEKAEKDAGALRGQVAALHGLLTVFLAEWEDENEAGLARSVVAFRQVLADTESAAREHDEAVRTEAREETLMEAAAAICRGCAEGWPWSDPDPMHRVNHSPAPTSTGTMPCAATVLWHKIAVRRKP